MHTKLLLQRVNINAIQSGDDEQVLQLFECSAKDTIKEISPQATSYEAKSFAKD